jgi:hypothetical protein
MEEIKYRYRYGIPYDVCQNFLLFMFISDPELDTDCFFHNRIRKGKKIPDLIRFRIYNKEIVASMFHSSRAHM